MRFRSRSRLLVPVALLSATAFGFQAPDFSISASPGTQTVWQANSGSYLVTVTASNGFSGVVNLTATGLPTGATAAFSPATVTGSGTSTMTVSASPGTPVGSSTLTITGTSGSLTHNTTSTLNVVVPPPINYTYDPVGRLTSVTDQSGNSAIYSYDAVGNLLSISRQNANQVTISTFSPAAGPVGTSVMVLGSGFSSTLNQNLVKINGVTATVTAAGNTLLTAVVPVAATSGPISVSVSGGATVTSASSFTVTATSGAPTITSFTPTLASQGVAINVIGTNFSTNLASNTMKVAATTLPVQAATATSLSSSTPTVSGSGHISVQTPNGQATSTGDFFFVPSPYIEANVALATRATLGVPVSATFSATQQIAIVVFDGTQGQFARLLTNQSLQGQVAAIYKPDGSVLLSDTALANYFSGVLDTPVFPTTGTYTILVKSNPGFEGLLNLTITSPASAGDFGLAAVPDFYQNSPTGPAFAVFVNAGTGLAQNIQLSTSGLPACATPNFSASQFGASGTSQLTFTLNSCAAGSYAFSVTGTAGSLTHTINLTLNVNPLPSPWLETDIDTQSAGHTDYSNGTFSIIGWGGGSLFATDDFHFDYQPLSGDGSIVARVVSLYNAPTGPTAFGGVMIREALTDSASTMYLRLNSTVGAELGWRTSTSGTLNTLSGPAVTTPYWLKVTRAGNVLTAFISPDGAAWSQVGSPATMPMASSIFMGLTAAANPFGRPALAVFDNVTLTSAPDFTVAPTPVTQTVVPSATASYTVSVSAIGGFGGAVNLSTSALPAGTTATFTPTSITGAGTSTLAIVTAANTPLGSYPVTVTGTSGVLTRSTPLTLVVGGPDYSLSANPSSANVLVGNSVIYTLTLTPTNGFTGVVNLSAAGLPAGATVLFSPTSITGAGTATATVTVGANTPQRTYQLGFIGTSGSLTHSTNANLTVIPTDFGVSIDAAWVAFPSGGGSVNRTVTITAASGFAKTVTLSASLLPAGATVSFNPPTVTISGTSVMTVTAPGGLPAAVVHANVVGTVIDTANGNPTHSIPLIVVDYPSGSLPAGWTNTNIGSPTIPGAAGFSTNTFTIQGSGGGILGQSDQLNFTYQNVSGDTTIIARVTGKQSQDAVAGLMIRETLDAASKFAYVQTSGIPIGEVMIWRNSTGAGVFASGGIAIALPEWVKLVRQSDTFTTYLSADGMNWTQVGSATISMASSVFVGLAVAENNTTAGMATLDSVTVAGSSPDFYLVPTPFNRSLPTAASSDYRTVELVPLNGYTNNTTMSVSGLPAGATASLSPASIAGAGGTNLQINLPSNIAAGTYPVTVSATNGTITRSTVIQIATSPQTAGLPTPWAADDVGFGQLAGTSSITGLAQTIQAAGSTIANSTENFRYNYQSLTGDGTIYARIDLWASFYGAATLGVMIREKLEADATNVCMCLWGMNGTTPSFQYRPTQGASTTTTFAPGPVPFPYWFKLIRSGSQFSGFTSSDGVNWQQLGQTVTVNMAPTVFMGIAVSSNNMGVASTATFNEARAFAGPDFYLVATPASRNYNSGNATNYFTVTGHTFNNLSGSVALSASGLPTGATATFANGSVTDGTSDQLRIDTASATPPGTYVVTVTGVNGTTSHSVTVTLTVGSTTNGIVTPWTFDYIGSETGTTPAPAFSNGTYTVSGLGCCIGDSSDSLTLLYQAVTGDTNVTARIATEALTNPPFQNAAGAGVMVRESLDPASKFAFAQDRVVGPSSFGQYRATTGGADQFGSNGDIAVVPYWVKLVRQGNTIGQYGSRDGANWLQLGSASVPMNSTVLAGLAATGNGNATFDNVSIDHSSDFLLGYGPTTLLLAPGSSITVTLNAFSTGSFNGTINWAATNLPAGVSASFNPTSVTGAGSSTLTLTATPSTVMQAYQITVTGTSGALSHSLTIPLTVAPDFTLAITPASQTVWKGNGTSYTVTISSLAGFAGTVSLSAVGLSPSEGSLSWFTNPITGGSGTTTLFAGVSSNIPQFPKVLTVTATSGTITHTATVALVIGPEFVLGTGGAPSINPGQNGTTSLSVSPLGGFNSNVTLSALNPPTGVTITFSPAVVTGGSGSATATIATTTQATGSGPVTVQGVGGGLTRTASINYFIVDFSLNSVAPSSQTVVAGAQTNNYAVSMSLNHGYAGTITFGTTGLPAGATGAFTPTTRSSSSSTNLKITTTTSVAAGTYPFTITGINNATGLQRTIAATLIVTGDFSITTGASTVTTNAAASPNPTLSVTVNAIAGYNGTVALSVTSGLPTGATASFSPASLTPGTSTLTLSTTAATPGGNSTITISGTDGTLTHTKTFTLTVKNYTLTVSPGSLSVAAGATTTAYTVTMTVTGGFASSVTFGTTGLPSGATPTFNPTTRSTTGTTALTIATTGAVAAGTYPFNITGSCSGCPTQTVAATLVVTNGFSLSTSVGSITIIAGQTGPVTVTVTASAGLGGSTALTISGLPSGTTAAFVPTSVSGSGTSTLTISPGTSATGGGPTALTITGTNGALTRTAVVNLTVQNFTLSASPTSLTVTHGGAAKTSAITLTMTGGFAGTTTFSVPSKPSGVTVTFNPTSRMNTGTTTMTVTAASGATLGTTTLTVTGTSGSLAHTTPVTLIVN